MTIFAFVSERMIAKHTVRSYVNLRGTGKMSNNVVFV